MTSSDATAGRIAFGDDRSSCAEVAWRWINAHRWPGWEVDVLTATDPPSALWSWDVAPEESSWEPPEPRVADPVASLARVRHLTAAADPRVLLGHQDAADLVVVGPRGLGEVRAILLGGTTEWLVRNPPAPVAVVRTPDVVGRVLICVDGSAHARAALDAFLRWPWSGGVEAYVLTAQDRLSDIEKGETEALEALAARGIEATTVRSWGHATPAILHNIDEIHPDLTIMGTRGTTVWKRLLLGSTASAVIHVAPCSVLVAGADT